MPFQITARTVLELGSELISSDIIAFYELIKNGFDAGTQSGIDIRFRIVLRRNDYLRLLDKIEAAETFTESLVNSALAALIVDAPQELFDEARDGLSTSISRRSLLRALDKAYSLSTIVVEDSGSGMTSADLVNNFLVIGTASRKRDVDLALQRGASKSPFLGEKGIGRLSAMRLGETLRVETATAADSHLNVLDIDWSDFANINKMLDEVEVEPSRGQRKPDREWSGTRIIIGALAEDWTESRVNRMAEYDFARLTDPFVDQKKRPRVAIHWNDERVKIPWMEQELLSSSHASIRGTYKIVDGEPVLRCEMVASNLGFEHPVEKERSTAGLADLRGTLIGRSREIPESALVDLGEFKFEMYWFNRRLLRAIQSIGDLTTIRKLQERWSGILLFRDGFRVFPYGDDDDDWLGLDRKALRRSGYTLNKTQFIGRVEISRVGNPSLVDQTNREGLRETPEQQVLLEILQFVIQDQLFRFMKAVERQYKDQPIDLADAKTEVEALEKRAKSAITKLRRLAPNGGEEIDALQQTLFEFSDFAERARQRIDEVERESRQMIEMAGVGLMVEVVAHELARASENALENLEALRGRDVPEEVKAKLASLRAQMKSLGKRVRVLDPLSVSGRQRVESFDLASLIEETLEAHEGQFERHNIRIKFDMPDGRVPIRAVKGMVIQILENLISNSKYWIDMRPEIEKSTPGRIQISLTNNPPTVVYEDNGPGISPENKERVFRTFFSLKEKTQRRGLGLFIARECATYLGGTLTLDETPMRRTGRLAKFILELP